MVPRRAFLQWPFLLAASGKSYRAKTLPEFSQAVKSARPGDTIVLADGQWDNADLVFEAEGVQDAPITVRAQTPGKVILTGQSRLRLGGRHLVVEGLRFEDGEATEAVISFRTSPQRLAHHCRVTHCTIHDYRAPNEEKDTKWVSLYGTYNRFDHNSIRGKTNAGTTLVVWLDGLPNFHQIDHNFFGPRPPLGKNGGETIRVGTSDLSMSNSRTLVESNYFSQCNGEIEIISNKSCENIYRRNTFVDCEGTLTLRHGNRCLVEENVFLGHGLPQTGGVRIIGEDHRVLKNYFQGLAGEQARSALSMMNGLPESPLNGYFRVRRARVAGNIFVDCRATMTLGIPSQNPKGATLAPEDCRIIGNYLRGTHDPLILLPTPPERCQWEGNIAYGAKLGLEDATGFAIADRPIPVGPVALTARDVGPGWLSVSAQG